MRDIIFPANTSRGLQVARAGALVIMILLLLAWLGGAVLWIRGLSNDLDTLLAATFFNEWTADEVRSAAAGIGVPLSTFPIAWFGVEVIILTSFSAMSFLLYWKKPDWFGTFLALGFMFIATAISGPVITRVDAFIPGWSDGVYAGLIAPFSFLALISISYLFPDGRFVPSWSKWILFSLAAAFMIFMAVEVVLGGVILPEVPEAEFLIPVILMVVGVAGQIYRYFRVSGAVERRQTRGIIVALAVFLSLNFLGYIFAPNTQTFNAPPSSNDLVAYLVFYYGLAIAVVGLVAAITIAVLRYGLWDIDLIIRRTTSYAVITSLLALIYFGSIVILQRVLAPITGESDVAVVLSTLLIAALFLPIRRRVQNAIDRRFNRTRYDAERTLEAFAATVRNEPDLDTLTSELLRVIQQTMEPESLSIWLRDPTKEQERNDSTATGRTWKREDSYDRPAMLKHQTTENPTGTVTIQPLKSDLHS